MWLVGQGKKHQRFAILKDSVGMLIGVFSTFDVGHRGGEAVIEPIAQIGKGRCIDGGGEADELEAKFLSLFF